jgi:hypothetical protein
VTIIEDLMVTLDKDTPAREVRIGAFWTSDPDQTTLIYMVHEP